MLDEIVPDKPVSLKSDGHSLWANSIALEISNINESTIDLKNGAIERYPNSREPSGLLHEDSAMMLVMDNHPELTNKELIDGLKYSRDEFHRLGITGVQDALLKLDPGSLLRLMLIIILMTGMNLICTLSQQCFGTMVNP